MIDWGPVRAEYIGGGISQRKLAQKYGISETTLLKRANAEEWNKLRQKARNKSTTEAQRKTANVVSNNAVLAADIKKRLLVRLQHMEQKYPLDATEVRTRKGDTTAIFRIRDLTAAFRDLTGDMNLNSNNEPVRIIIDV